MFVFLAASVASNPSPVLLALERRFEIRVRQGDAPTSSFASVKFSNLTAADAVDAAGYAFILAKELSKYPVCLVKKSGLKQVALVKDLTLDGVPVGAVGDYKQDILYCNPFVGKFAATDQRHIIHHDFFHLLEEEQNGSAYFKDPEWLRTNPSAFEYGKGGIHSRDESDTALNNPSPGFITRYAMSGIEEDRAEIFACLFVPAQRRTLEAFAEKDEILASGQPTETTSPSLVP